MSRIVQIDSFNGISQDENNFSKRFKTSLLGDITPKFVSLVSAVIDYSNIHNVEYEVNNLFQININYNIRNVENIYTKDLIIRPGYYTNELLIVKQINDQLYSIKNKDIIEKYHGNTCNFDYSNTSMDLFIDDNPIKNSINNEENLNRTLIFSSDIITSIDYCNNIQWDLSYGSTYKINEIYLTFKRNYITNELLGINDYKFMLYTNSELDNAIVNINKYFDKRGSLNWFTSCLNIRLDKVDYKEAYILSNIIFDNKNDVILFNNPEINETKKLINKDEDCQYIDIEILSRSGFQMNQKNVNYVLILKFSE